MDGGLLKLVFTAIGSGALLVVLLRLIGPALRLNQQVTEACARVTKQWEELYGAQTARVVVLENQLNNAIARIHELEQKAKP